MSNAFSKKTIIVALSIALTLPYGIAFAEEVLPIENLEREVAMDVIGSITSQLSSYSKMTSDMTISASAGQIYLGAQKTANLEFKALEDSMKLKIAALSDNKDVSAQREYLANLKDSYLQSKFILEKKLVAQKVAVDSYGTAKAQASVMRDIIGGTNEDGTVTNIENENKKYSLNSLSFILAKAMADDKPLPDTKLFTSSLFKNCSDKLGIIFDTGVDANGKPRTQGMNTPIFDACMRMRTREAIAKEIGDAQRAMYELVAAKEKIMSSAQNNTETQAAEAKARAAVKVLVARKLEIYKDTGLDKCPALFEGMEKSCGDFLTAVGKEDSPWKGQADLFRGLFGTGKEKISSLHLEKFIDFIFPKAQADALKDIVSSLLGSLLNLSGPSMLISNDLTHSMTPEIDNYMYTAKKRAVIWGTLENKAQETVEATEDEIKKVNQNIEKNDLIIEKMDKIVRALELEKRHHLEKLLDLFFPTLNAQTKALSTASPSQALDSNNKFPCVANQGSSHCNSIASRFSATPDFSKLPLTLKNLGKEITSISDEISGKTSIGQKALSMEKSMADKHEKIHAYLKKQDRIKDEKEKKLFWNKITGITTNIFNKHKTTPTVFLASLGGVQNVLPKSKAHIKETISNNTEKIIPTQSATKTEMKNDKVPATIVAENAKKNDKKFKFKDINTNNNDSIFQVISDRYLKSAYKLFER